MNGEFNTNGGRPRRPAAFGKGFTLVELLVVMGIIAVLIGILIPVTVSARYRARIIRCSSNLRQVGQGLLMYCNDHKGRYPVRNFGTDDKASLLYAGVAATDQRALLNGYIDFNTIGCPLAPKPLDYQNHTGSTCIEWTYSMWGGYRFQLPNEKGAIKAGEPFTYQGKSYSVLGSDQQWDWISAGSSDPSGYVSEGEHPTSGMNSLTQNDSTVFFTRWNNSTTQRGPVDLNFLYNDGSVITIYRIGFNYWLPSSPNYRTDVVALPVWASNTTSPWSVVMPAGN